MNRSNLRLQVTEEDRQAIMNLDKNLNCVSCKGCNEWWKVIVLLLILCLIIYYFKMI
jgi:hypothetical protein